MNKNENLESDVTKNIKLFSSKSITLATFFGGPLASGYLIAINFNNLKEYDKGRKSLIIGIISTLALFYLIFFIPESIIDKIPNQIIPLIYTGIIWLIVDKTQGRILKAHKENKNEFYSGWRASGVGLVSLLIILAGVFGYSYIEMNNPAYEIYDSKMTKFSENESLKFYDNVERKGRLSLLEELDGSVIPAWKSNIDITKNIKSIENLPSELIDKNEIILQYSQTRLELFLLTRRAIDEDTNKYDYKIFDLNSKIENLLSQLN